jgi:hypothetical protein
MLDVTKEIVQPNGQTYHLLVLKEGVIELGLLFGVGNETYLVQTNREMEIGRPEDVVISFLRPSVFGTAKEKNFSVDGVSQQSGQFSRIRMTVCLYSYHARILESVTMNRKTGVWTEIIGLFAPVLQTAPNKQNLCSALG